MKKREMANSADSAALQEKMHKDAFPRLIISLLLLITAYYMLFFLTGCATTPDLPPHPPKYVYREEKVAQSSVNSLWHDTASLYEDRKARRLNDLVTINVVENITASGKATTKTSRDSSSGFAMTDLFGMNKDFNIQNLPLIKDFYKGNSAAGPQLPFTPSLSGTATSAFDGKGDTSREGKLIGTITAKVVEVMPNGTLVLESRKDTTINKEKQTLVLRGMIRPDDILPDNSILSSYVADAQIFYVGQGVLQEKQSPGWLTRIMDQVWPF
ncbi:MAG: flagellar basal body L-ring protein FlgH [Nitrospirae bacterium]|nr:flagellar basal body L-ring protein FlgH [Nitrospirota bacterium]